MKAELTQIQLKNDEADNYYLGYVVSRKQELTTMICLDSEGSEGGTLFLKNEAISQETTASPEISFYQYLIDRGMSKDPFQLSVLNQTIIKQDFPNLAAALAYALKKQQIITIDASNGFAYTGLLTAVTDQNIQIREKNDEFELESFATVIPLAKIDGVDFNESSNVQFAHWLQSKEQGENDLNLVKIYLNYQDDQRYGRYLTGKIIAQMSHYQILVEKYSEVGQISAMTLVNRDHIMHIGKHGRELAYLAHQIKEDQKRGVRDPYDLRGMVRMSGFFFDSWHLPTIEKILAWEKGTKNLINVDDIDYSTANIGQICAYQYQDKQFTQELLDGYQLKGKAIYHLDRIAAIDLFSPELLQLQLYLDEKNSSKQVN